MKKISQLLLFIALLAAASHVNALEIPYLSGRVNDYAGVLSGNARELLSEQLREHEACTSNQIVVLTLPSLQGENIEDFSNQVFNAWELGQEGQDNGILIVVVPDERQMRIEVGYGLEGLVPDITAGRVIREIMAPRFREGDYDAGISEGAQAIMSVLEGQELPAGESPGDYDTFESGLSDFDSGINWPMKILFGAFIFGIIGLFTVVGVMTPGMGWFLYVFLIPFWATFPIMIVGTKGTMVLLVLYVSGYPIAKLSIRKTAWFKKALEDQKTKGKSSIGGFSFSSGGSGRSWSSGSSGSFSGGGGSSGGGGASGSW